MKLKEQTDEIEKAEDKIEQLLKISLELHKQIEGMTKLQQDIQTSIAQARTSKTKAELELTAYKLMNNIE